MKKIIFSVLLSSALFACKKDKGPACETTVAGISANYKITKIEIVSGSGSTDVSSTFLDDCTRSGLYQLKADKSAIYTEAGSSCTGSGTGSWDVSNNNISISVGGFDFSNAPIKSWDCNTLTVTDDFSSSGITASYRFTFVKQ